MANRVVAAITYENGHRICWNCDTSADAVKCWHREMTEPKNAFNPAVAVEWISGDTESDDGVVIGAMRRPDPPKNEAWAQVVMSNIDILVEEKEAAGAGAG